MPFACVLKEAANIIQLGPATCPPDTEKPTTNESPNHDEGADLEIRAGASVGSRVKVALACVPALFGKTGKSNVVPFWKTLSTQYRRRRRSSG